MLRLSKLQLDDLSTLCGLVSGICTVLVSNQVISTKVGSTVGGIALVILGFLTNKTATRSPTTEQLEEQSIKRDR